MFLEHVFATGVWRLATGDRSLVTGNRRLESFNTLDRPVRVICSYIFLNINRNLE